jgi:hypothetical protein
MEFVAGPEWLEVIVLVARGQPVDAGDAQPPAEG